MNPVCCRCNMRATQRVAGHAACLGHAIEMRAEYNDFEIDVVVTAIPKASLDESLLGVS